MRLFRRTTAALAARVLTDGFVDATGTFLTNQVWSGVWLSDMPLDCNDGVIGDTLLQVDIDLDEQALDDFEWKEEGKCYWEWLVPASLVNQHARVSIINDTDDSLFDPDR